MRQMSHMFLALGDKIAKDVLQACLVFLHWTRAIQARVHMKSTRVAAQGPSLIFATELSGQHPPHPSALSHSITSTCRPFTA